MTLHTPPENQGQIVEVSYGWQAGCLYRRVVDRSDRSVSWSVASDDDEVNAYVESGEEPWNKAPRITRWAPCAEPAEEED